MLLTLYQPGLKTIVKFWEVPLQKAYLRDVIQSGHPGFVHSCFLGAYWNSPPYHNPVLEALPVAQGGTAGRTRSPPAPPPPPGPSPPHASPILI